MLQPLTLVKIMDRILYRSDCVTQVSVVSPTISGVDSGRFDGDELLPIKVFNVLRNGVSAHVNSLTYGLVARITLVGLSILAVHQVGIDSDLTEGQSERKDFIRQRKIFFDGVTLVILTNSSYNSHDNLVFQKLKSIFGGEKSVVEFQDRRLV